MRHWSRLATRNWQVKKVRTFGAVLAVALGTAAVVWVSCCHESVRRSVTDWAGGYVGNAHVTVASSWGKHDQIPERIARKLRDLDNVEQVTPMLLLRRSGRLITRSDFATQSADQLTWRPDDLEFDLRGIDLDTEFLMRSYDIVAGRMLNKNDTYSCLLEAADAHAAGVDLGDFLLVWDPTVSQPIEFEIVGLYERQRIGRIQKPLAVTPIKTLQQATHKVALVSTVDVKLKNTERDVLRKSVRDVYISVRSVTSNAIVRSAEARMRQIEVAQNNQRTVLVMLGCVTMLTSLFIILSTLSMGLLERIRQLGLMRCIGMTRFQLALLVLVEVVPLGIVGVVLGIPLGLALTGLSVWLVPDYIGSFVVAWDGIVAAIVAGIATSILAAILPAIAILRVSPMEAAHPQARRPRLGLLFIVFALAAIALVVQHFVVIERAVRSVQFLSIAAFAVVLLYVGYAMLAAPLVRLIGAPAVVLAALVLRVRTRLLQDQVGYAVWRSAGICCGLMVGLSLIVGIVVVNESVRSGWQFPKKFPAAYIWTFSRLPIDTRQRLSTVPGVGEMTLASSINVIVEERPLIGEELLKSFTWFMGIEPDKFLDLVKAEFLEGDEQTARKLLKQGGHIIIADDFSRSRNKHLGDDVRIYDERSNRWHHFKVAGVARSPALDIAAGYFQLQTEYETAAAGSVLGSIEDVRSLFGVHSPNLALFNFDLAPAAMPVDWPPERGTKAASWIPKRFYDESLPVATRWQRFREYEVLQQASQMMRSSQLFSGTVADLKAEIDGQLSGVTGLLTAIPTVALLVAAIGVANLMTANVTSRAKQIAIIRAVGSTRGLILRMVVGEALVLGLLGCALGLALGLHLATNIIQLVEQMWGFRVALDLPWPHIILAIVLTVGLCVVAGVLPARHAARTNVVDALHVT